jgi:carbon-monoxide dehydrogenase large subunit
VARTVLGHAVHRVEDAGALRGDVRYVEDLAVAADACWAVFVRAVDAHAQLRSVDVTDARAAPGVVGVFTDDDLGLPPAAAMGGDGKLDRPRLARDRVRFVGEPIAVVVARTRAQAYDAAELVVTTTDPLAAVVDGLTALQNDAPRLFPEFGVNTTTGPVPDRTGGEWPDADVVVRARFVNQRVAPVPMEANGVLVVPDGGRLDIWASTQSVFGVRREVASALGMDEADVVVRASAVGGGFGAKGGVYNEQVVVAGVARRLRRPIAWSETRQENLLTMTHGRDQVQDVELGARSDGTIVGLRVRAIANVGAYPVRGAFVPMVTRFMASGPYRIPSIDFHAVVAVTNTTPTGPYRGAGRPEAAALLERAVDVLAGVLGLDPRDVRRRNYVPADAFPYRTPTGAEYDSGDYARALDEAAARSGYERWRTEQAARRQRGDRLQLGIGIGSYVEVSGRGGEYGHVRIEADGTATVVTGSVPQGQAHETVWAQITSAVLGVPMEQVRVLHSDTTIVAHGVGTFGSRSLQLAGSAVHDAASAVLDQARQLAADVLEASIDDIVLFGDGETTATVGVAGSPAAALTWEQIGRSAAANGVDLAAGVDFDSDGTFPSGTHVAVVELDTETGRVTLLHHVAVDDCGRVINPLVVAGQAHGGIAQGVAQALFEHVVYDVDGNPLTTSLLDYAVPSAADLPSFEVHHTVTQTTRNPLGAKGVGESGTTGGTAAVWNAVVDALAPFGVRHLDMPFTPQRVWHAMNGNAPDSVEVVHC